MNAYRKKDKSTRRSLPPLSVPENVSSGAATVAPRTLIVTVSTHRRHRDRIAIVAGILHRARILESARPRSSRFNCPRSLGRRRAGSPVPGGGLESDPYIWRFLMDFFCGAGRTSLGLNQWFGAFLNRTMPGQERKVSMWLHKGLDWWGFVLAVAALILAYPLEVVAHITAPKWKDWWATRSRTALEKRILELEWKLALIKNVKPLSDTEIALFSSLAATNTGIQWILICLAIALLGSNFALEGSLLFSKMLSALTFVMWFIVLVLAERAWEFKNDHMPGRPAEIQEQINKLKAKIK